MKVKELKGVQNLLDLDAWGLVLALSVLETRRFAKLPKFKERKKLRHETILLDSFTFLHSRLFPTKSIVLLYTLKYASDLYID